MSTNHNIFEEKGEPKRYRTVVLPLTSLTPYSEGKTEGLEMYGHGKTGPSVEDGTKWVWRHQAAVWEQLTPVFPPLYTAGRRQMAMGADRGEEGTKRCHSPWWAAGTDVGRRGLPSPRDQPVCHVHCLVFSWPVTRPQAGEPVWPSGEPVWPSGKSTGRWARLAQRSGHRPVSPFGLAVRPQAGEPVWPSGQATGRWARLA